MLDGEGRVTPDFSGKLPGRGAWVTATGKALEAAIKSRAFARSFKAEAIAPKDLAAAVEAGLAKTALAALGLARRVGDAAIGFDQAKRLLETGKAAVLIGAGDGAEDGKRKLKSAGSGVSFFGFFDSRELSAAVGREGVVHIALKKGPAAARFAREARRLEGFRTAFSSE